MQDSSSSQGEAGHCLLLIRTPSDDIIYGCFRSVAQRWREHLTAERLWIDGNVPLTPGLTASRPPAPMDKLVNAALNIIARIEVQFGGLTVSYVRAGGHGPLIYRNSLFDELRFTFDRPSTLNVEEIRLLSEELCACLDVAVVTGSSDIVSARISVPYKTLNVPLS